MKDKSFLSLIRWISSREGWNIGRPLQLARVIRVVPAVFLGSKAVESSVLDGQEMMMS